MPARFRRSDFRQLGEQQRQLDVLLGRQHGQKVVELEHEPDVLRAPLRQLAAAQRADGHAVDFDGAAGRRVEPADQIEQRRLAGPRRSHQRQEIALRDFQVHAFEHVDALAAAGEMFVDVLDANEFIHMLSMVVPLSVALPRDDERTGRKFRRAATRRRDRRR